MNEESHHAMEVLVVDDNPINHRVVLFSLRDQFKNIDTAFNGQEAVDKFKQKHYDLILMDLRMPIMDGREAVKHIRDYINTNGIEKPVKIVAMTASDMEEDTLACIEAGMDAYLCKPFRMQELFKVIK